MAPRFDYFKLVLIEGGAFFVKKPRILLANPIHIDAIAVLQKHAEVVEHFGISHDDLMRVIPTFAAVITRSDNAITPEILDSAPNLKVVGRAAIGVDTIDIAYATKKKIAVVNAPTGNCIAAAEHTISLIFSLARHIPAAHADIARGIWGKHKYVGMQLEGKTLGIIGLGRVGKHVMQIAQGIGLNILYYDPFVTTSTGGKKVTLTELLAKSDIVTLHTPHTKLTDQLINEHTLSHMKKTAYLINCARGKVVDEHALVNALKNNDIAGAALDVFEKEPLQGSELTTLDTVILTPHIGGSTYEAQRATGLEVAEGVLSILRGEKPNNLLNPEIYVPKMTQFDDITTIIFDCDSTLVTIEGIDELARAKGVEDQIVPLTEKAMNGEIAPEEVFKKRLEIIKPTKKELRALGTLYIQHLLPGTKEILMHLKNNGIELYIVSGGYDLSLHVLADYLGIPRKNVYGNKLTFKTNGTFDALDESIPLWKTGGKETIIRTIPRSGRSILLGDGVTDAEAKNAVDIFIGFGGVKKRELVKNRADIYLETPTLAPLLHIANTSTGRHNRMTIVEREYGIAGLDDLLNPEMTTFAKLHHKEEIVQQLVS